MDKRLLFMRAALVALLAFISFSAFAQPQLPDIAGSADRGIVVLTWNCQFEGVKSIAVQRSSDSVHNFATVGYVKNIKKGIQAFVDGHPAPGKNYYQLYIVFSSDLTWNSNHIKIQIDSATLLKEKLVLPPNDSLQRFVISEGSGDIKSRKSGIVVHIDTSDKPVRSTRDNVISSAQPAQNGTGIPDSAAKPRKISISILPDVYNDVNPYAYIKSHYVFTNPLTGHVNLDLPEVTAHFYEIKFYDEKENQVLEVPRIRQSPIIIDKRNFEQKGLYKFILQRDNKELETGFITIY